MYYLVALITNTSDQHSQTINPFASFDLAVVNYHQKLANFHNASDVAFAVVEILDEYGRIVPNYTETVDHSAVEA